MSQLVKNLSALWETWVQSLGWEDPLEKGKATHSGSGAAVTDHAESAAERWYPTPKVRGGD